jgi:hypothetical protein
MVAETVSELQTERFAIKSNRVSVFETYTVKCRSKTDYAATLMAHVG